MRRRGTQKFHFEKITGLLHVPDATATVKMISCYIQTHEEEFAVCSVGGVWPGHQFFGAACAGFSENSGEFHISAEQTSPRASRFSTGCRPAGGLTDSIASYSLNHVIYFSFWFVLFEHRWPVLPHSDSWFSNIRCIQVETVAAFQFKYLKCFCRTCAMHLHNDMCEKPPHRSFSPPKFCLFHHQFFCN